ncbi:(2Fe-2S)-binding protein [Thalassotalea sediminis]|uniref:(2Fe-2S)-binding protein n=1 Tax=Thalassotalea sediminis TaxID=1759089 RepID=UPI0025746D5E|nr:(2Fe-2S)-binding protein [Thalassotalea sediminis]
MFVCICNGITDKNIQEVVRNKGAGTMRELKKHLNIGKDCGSCVKAAQQVIDNTIIDESLFQDVG